MSDIEYKEEKIKSPVDGTDMCFKVYSIPSTEDYYLCMSSGFTTTSKHTITPSGVSDAVLNMRKTAPKLVTDLEWIDWDRELVWTPSILNMGKLGIIFPEGTKENWVWKYAKIVEIPKEEQKNYPVPNKEGKFYESRLDIEGAQIFKSTEFLDACKAMGIVDDKRELKIKDGVFGNA